MTNLEQFRAHKDQFFRNHPQSPLTMEQQQTFQGLAYFDERDDLRFAAVVEVFSEQASVEMQTTTGETQMYIRYGRVRVLVDEQEAVLTLYAAEHGFFLPFADALAGTETYGAGRYLDPQPLNNEQVLIDFNLAYNPYCAYNDQWSCPITPFENRLKIPIRAGEKLWDDEH